MPTAANPFNGVQPGQMAGTTKFTSSPLTKLQQRQIAEAKPVYIYNVSPIHQWHRLQGQLGTVIIPKREAGERVSRPCIIPGMVCRHYDKGLNRKEAFIEDGWEVAEDIVGCSKEYPAPEDAPNNNLANLGVFITRKLFEELSAKEQNALVEEANKNLAKSLRNLVLQADNFWAGPMKMWVSEMHRQALNALNLLEGSKEERPWAPIQYGNKTEDCKFCGTANKPGLVICPQCRSVLDDKRFAEMKGKQAS